LVVFKAKAN